jgi:hypothetical protein
MNQQQKDEWLAKMRDHQYHDRFAQGEWLQSDGVRGCFYGCAMRTHVNVLERAAEAMGLPLWFVKLTEAIFEGLPEDLALRFPVEVLEAIPVDTDLTPVEHSMAIARLSILAERYPQARAVFNDVIERHKNWEATTEDRWHEVRQAVRTHVAASPSLPSSMSCVVAPSSTWAASAAAWVTPAVGGNSYNRFEAWQAARIALLNALKELS